MIARAVGADLLAEFPQHRRAWVLVRVDAALRQLPAAGRSLRARQIGATRDQHPAVAANSTAPTLRRYGSAVGSATPPWSAASPGGDRGR